MLLRLIFLLVVSNALTVVLGCGASQMEAPPTISSPAQTVVESVPPTLGELRTRSPTQLLRRTVSPGKYQLQSPPDGVREVIRDTGVPVAFGVLTTDDVEQAHREVGQHAAGANEGDESHRQQWDVLHQHEQHQRDDQRQGVGG